MELKLLPVGGYGYVATIAVVLLVLLARVAPRHVQLPWKRLAMLKVLRLLAIALLLVALLRPTLVLTRSTPLEASLLLIVDRTRSMQVEDSLDNRSRYDTQRLMLDAAADDLAELKKKWNLTAYTFADTLEAIEIADNGQVKLPPKPDGDQTPIGYILEELLETEADERLRGVLILGDGAQRAVPPRDAAAQLIARHYAAERIPLMTFPFGQPGGSDRSDLAIDDLLVSGSVFANAPVEVRGQLRADGYANRDVKVQLLWEDAEGEMQVVDTTEQSIVGAESRMPLTLTHTPTEPGEYKVTLRSETPEGELIATNNESSTFVTVREGGIKVLYLSGTTRVGGGPGLEQAGVRWALATSPDILVTHRQFDYAPMQISFLEEFEPGKYDVVMLDDVDKLALNDRSWKALRDMVRAGTGLFMGGGYHSFGPGGHRTSGLQVILPIEIGPAENQNFGEPLREDVHVAGPVKIQPAAPVGLTHPVAQIGPPPVADVWSKLPPLDGANQLSRARLKSNSQIILESADAARHPLLVVGQAGAGRTVAFAGDSTWRWRFEGHDLELRRFWRQIILYLAKKDGKQEGDVWLELDTRRVTRGGQLDIEVGWTPPSGQENADVQFALSIVDPNGNRIEVPTVAAGENRRVATFASTDQPGDYVAEVTSKLNGTALDSAKARFLVPTQDLELDRPGADPALMAQIAKITAEAGGETYAPEEFPSVIAKLAAEPPELKTEVTERRTYWDSWPFLLTFVACVGFEWFLRKRWGLV